MKFIILLLIPLVAFGSRIQNEDVKSEAQLLSAGGTKSQLINDTKIYVNQFSKRLDEAITDGDIGGGIDAWVTSKSYSVGDLVLFGNEQFKAITNHTSGAFKTDFEALRWVKLTNQKDILTNGDFEEGSTGWVFTGSATLSNETSVTFLSPSSVKIEASSQAFNLSYDTSYNASQFTSGQPAILSMWVHNTNDILEICFKQASTTSYCLPSSNIPKSGDWQWVSVPVVLKGTSNGVEIKAASSTGVTYIDKVQLELKDPLELQQVQYKAVLDATGSGDFTGGSVLVTRQGNQVTVTVLTGLIHASASVVNSAAGFLPVWARPNNNKASSTYSAPTVITIFPLTDGTLQFAYANSTTGSGVSATGTTVLPTISYSVNDNLENTLFTYDRCNDRRNCETVFSAKVSSTGVVSGENLDWINGNASITSTSTYALTFINLFSVAPTCTVSLENAGSDGANVVVYVRQSPTTTGIGIRSILAGTAAPTAQSFNIVCQRSGQDYLNAKVNQILGQFLASNLDGGVDLGLGVKGKEFGVSVTSNCTTSPCTVHKFYGTIATGVVRTGVGSYTLQYSDSGSVPLCNINTIQTSAGNATVTCQKSGTPTSSSYGFLCKQGTAAIDYNFDIRCLGVSL